MQGLPIILRHQQHVYMRTKRRLLIHVDVATDCDHRQLSAMGSLESTAFARQGTARCRHTPIAMDESWKRALPHDWKLEVPLAPERRPTAGRLADAVVVALGSRAELEATLDAPIASSGLIDDAVDRLADQRLTGRDLQRLLPVDCSRGSMSRGRR